MSKITQVEAANIIEDQILQALKTPFKSHFPLPIRLVQASKSLIGLNLDFPNQILLKFNSSFLKNINTKSKTKVNLTHDINEVVTLHDLEEAFINKNKKNITDIMYQLSEVSSEIHILEYLIEISLKQSGKSFLSIWSLYKSILFLNDRSIKHFFNLAIDIIFEDKFEILSNSSINNHTNIIQYSNLSIEDIDLYSHLIELDDFELIREAKIKPLILNMIHRKFNTKKLADKINTDKKLKYGWLLDQGRFSLLEFVERPNKYKVNINLILFLDSIRCLFKFLDKKNRKLVCIQFEGLINNFYV